MSKNKFCAYLVIVCRNTIPPVSSPTPLHSLLHLKVKRRNWTWTMQILPSLPLLPPPPHKTSVYLLPFLLRQVECFVFIIITVRCGILMRLLCAPPTSERQTPRKAASFSLFFSPSLRPSFSLSRFVSLIYCCFNFLSFRG